ncbi:MAG: accessory factor UbiK family protein [Alphaproteobacteria bacterium]
MQTQSRFFDDMARLANGAAGVAAGMRREIEVQVRQRLERLLSDMDLVSRDEFEAVKAVAVKARSEQERLAKRVAELESRSAGKGAARSKPRAQTKRR